MGLRLKPIALLPFLVLTLVGCDNDKSNKNAGNASLDEAFRFLETHTCPTFTFSTKAISITGETELITNTSYDYSSLGNKGSLIYKGKDLYYNRFFDGYDTERIVNFDFALNRVDCSTRRREHLTIDCFKKVASSNYVLDEYEFLDGDLEGECLKRTYNLGYLGEIDYVSLSLSSIFKGFLLGDGGLTSFSLKSYIYEKEKFLQENEDYSFSIDETGLTGHQKTKKYYIYGDGTYRPNKEKIEDTDVICETYSDYKFNNNGLLTYLKIWHVVNGQTYNFSELSVSNFNEDLNALALSLEQK